MGGWKELEMIEMENDYQTMVFFYRDIYNEIFNHIELNYPAIYESKSGKVIFSDEYLKAMGALQKVDWRLDDILILKNHFNQESFKYFAMENFILIRHDLGKYLKRVKYIDFPNAKESIKKYDKVLKKYQDERDLKEAEYYYDFYFSMVEREIEIGEISNSINLLISDLETLSEKIDNSDIVEDTNIKLLNKRLKRTLNSFKEELKGIDT